MANNSPYNGMRRLWMAALLSLWAFAAMAGDKPDFMVDADWLAKNLKDPKLVVLEIRYHPHRYFTVGHIPGAVQVQRFKDLGDNHAIPSMRFPSREVFEHTLRSWGVNNDSTIVLYDDSVTALTSRAYFLLDLYGYDMNPDYPLGPKHRCGSGALAAIRAGGGAPTCACIPMDNPG